MNTYALRTMDAMYFASAAGRGKTGGYYDLATTQDHHLFDTLGIERRQEEVGDIKYKSADDHPRGDGWRNRKRDPELFQRNEEGGLSLQLYEPPMQFNDPHAWGMAIDLSRCIGCHACVVACQAENNMPIVGKEQVLTAGRCTGFASTAISRATRTIPTGSGVPAGGVPALRERPVRGGLPGRRHDARSEGLNMMVYNRCVGTRYCSNNCPYKVRRFNFFDCHSQDPRHDKYPKPWLDLPDTQQIGNGSAGRADAEQPGSDRPHARRDGEMHLLHPADRHDADRQAGQRRGTDDGEIMTACQQTCPAQAIVFGDLNDPTVEVSKWHQRCTGVWLLDAELNTKPRNQYLAKIRNPVET